MPAPTGTGDRPDDGPTARADADEGPAADGPGLSVGADWRGEDWFAVALDGGGDVADAGVVGGVGDLWGRYGDRAGRIVVGVPVGLPAEAPRDCDRLARAALGPRAGTVVAPPARAALRRRRFPVAARVHERETGRSLSRRAFGMSAGIARMDELLREMPRARSVVVPGHPELCFRAFAGAPLSAPPDNAAGYAERLAALAEYDVDGPRTVQRAAAATDPDGDAVVADVLAAAALAYTALPGPAPLRTLPPDPPTDGEGLPVRICYRAVDPLPGAGDGSGSG